MATFDLSVPGTLWVSAESTLYPFQNTDFALFTESSASVKSFQFLGSVHFSRSVISDSAVHGITKCQTRLSN